MQSGDRLFGVRTAGDAVPDQLMEMFACGLVKPLYREVLSVNASQNLVVFCVGGAHAGAAQVRRVYQTEGVRDMLPAQQDKPLGIQQDAVHIKDNTGFFRHNSLL